MAITTVRYVSTREKVVALTLDDGPHSVYTESALAALKKYNSQATWFVLGKLISGREKILKDIALSGNEIGNHSFDHISLTRLPYGQMVGQLSRTRSLISEYTGQFWPFFRPPNGAFNQTVLNAASSLGYKYNMLWSIDPRDYQASASQIIYRVLAEIQPGAIVVLHEVTASTTQALPVILSELRVRGYQAVSLSRLLQIVENINITFP